MPPIYFNSNNQCRYEFDGHEFVYLNGCGCGSYHYTQDGNGFRALFVVGVNIGRVAVELGTRKSSIPEGGGDLLAGEFDIKTYKPGQEIEQNLFATGTLIVRRIHSELSSGDQAMEGVHAYEICYDLIPVPAVIQEFGLVEGTHLVFPSMGLGMPGERMLHIGWDNNVYARVWEQPSSPPTWEWGYRLPGIRDELGSAAGTLPFRPSRRQG